MTKLEKKIKELQDEVIMLRARIALLEARPLVISVLESAPAVAAPVVVPSPTSYPWLPNTPTITCSSKLTDLQVRQNVQ